MSKKIRSSDPEESVTKLASRTLIKDLALPRVVSVRQDMTVEELRALFVESKIGAAPVVDETGRPVGIVTTTDIVREDQEDGGVSHLGILTQPGRLKGDYEALLGHGFHEETIPLATVGEIMSPFVCALPEEASLLRASALMAHRNVHRVIIVAGGRVVGMLTSFDVVRWVARCALGPRGTATLRNENTQEASVW